MLVTPTSSANSQQAGGRSMGDSAGKRRQPAARRSRPTLTEFIEDRLGTTPREQARNFLLRPFGAPSPAIFWRYWNPVYGWVLMYFVYRPLQRAVPRTTALVATFATCGFVGHDLIAWAVLRQIRFPFFAVAFALHGIIVVVTRANAFDLSHRSLTFRCIVNSTVLACPFGLVHLILSTTG